MCPVCPADSAHLLCALFSWRTLLLVTLPMAQAVLRSPVTHLQGLACCLPCVLALVSTATASLELVEEVADGHHLKGAAGSHWPLRWGYQPRGCRAGHPAARELPEPTLHSDGG